MLIHETRTTQLDDTGYGVVRLAFPGKTVTITRVTMNATPADRNAQGNVYRDFIGPPYLVDNTFTASTGDTSDTTHNLRDGNCLYVEWIGGSPGAQASVTYDGEQR